MLKVQIEIVPFGDHDHPHRRTIGTLNIGLERVDPGNIGQYVSVMITDGRGPGPANDVVEVRDHPRSEGAWDVVRRALEAHMDPDDPGRVAEPAADTYRDAVAAVSEAETGQGSSESGTTNPCGEIVAGEPAECNLPAPTLECPKCGNTETASMIGVEYTYDSPNRYDGVSEWNCQLCGCRWGRWSGRILEDGDSEKPYGRA